VCGHLEERIETTHASPRASSCGHCGKTFAPFFYIVDEISEVSADLPTLERAVETGGEFSTETSTEDAKAKRYRPLIGFTLCWELDLTEIESTLMGHFKKRKSRAAPRAKAAR
jgi:hypothetical protein